jgi:hypothetical protein
VLDHPAYSPDLAPSDEEVKEAVQEWLAAQSKTFFSAGIQKLMERWNKCIEKHGDYFEK